MLDDAPLWLAGRVAMRGLPLFEVDAEARVRWQVEVRWRYLQVLPGQRLPDAARRWALAERPLIARTG